MNALLLLKRLAGIRQFTVHVEFPDDLGGSHYGEGLTTVRSESAAEVILFDCGRWSRPTHLRFSGGYRWNFANAVDGFKIDHIRHGADNPVFLAALVPVNPFLYKNLESYHCEADSYDVEVRFMEEEVVMQWSIRGPRKNQNLCIRYR